MGQRELDAIHRVRRAVSLVERRHGLSELDYITRELLYFIGEQDGMGCALCAAEIIACDRFGSAPSVYKRLQELKRQGWITGSRDPLDRRTVHLTLTRGAWEVVRKVSVAAAKALTVR